MSAVESVATTVRPARRLAGRLRMPGDKSITHRALLLAGAARGRSTVTGASAGLDPRSTAACLAALGVTVGSEPGEDGLPTYHVESPGLAAWRSPTADLDCGNSGTTLRLLAGLLAGAPVEATLDGDESLRSRPVGRIVEPLRAMGAEVTARDGGRLPPVTVRGGQPLRAIDHASPVPSAQVKSALLLAGLSAKGTTVVRESVATRDHTERMLRARGVMVDGEVDDARPAGVIVRMVGGQAVAARDEAVPGDPSAAAFWLVAAACHPEAELTLEGVGVNPTRRAIIDILLRMGADIELRAPSMGAGEPRATVVDDDEPRATMGADAGVGEPVADLRVHSSRLAAVELGPAEVAAAIDEIPVLCLAAACADGTSRFRGAGELRHKESDRLTGATEGLNALGARVTIEGDDLVIVGGAGLAAHGLRGGEARALGDHRLAMTFATAGLLAAGPVGFDGGSIAVSYPNFLRDLERIRA